MRSLDVASKVYVVAELEGRRTIELLGGLLHRGVPQPRRRVLLRRGRDGAVHRRGGGRRRGDPADGAPAALDRLGRAALGLLLGGATGNLVDRLLRSPGVGRGAVVDFIDFRVWPVFNLADSAIVVGGVLAVLLSLRGIEVDGTPDGPGRRARGPAADRRRPGTMGA